MSSGFAKRCFEEAYKAGWNDCVSQMYRFQADAAEYETDMFAEIYEGTPEPEEDGYDEENMLEAWRNFCKEEWSEE